MYEISPRSNAERRIAPFLRNLGHDVKVVAVDFPPDISDHAVLAYRTKNNGSLSPNRELTFEMPWVEILPHEQGGCMYSQVLVPLDGSEASERALPHAQSLAGAFGARVHLLQVISLSHEYEAYLGGGEESPMVSEYSLDMADQITATAQTRAEEYLKATAARLEVNGIHVQTSVQQGSTLDNITNFVAENGIDLIVMSTHGRSGLQRFLIGSVTDRVIRFSHVPVLAIPPED